MVWQAKFVGFWITDEWGLPVGPYHLLICRRVLDPTEVKFFLSNAPTDTPATMLLLMVFDRSRRSGLAGSGVGIGVIGDWPAYRSPPMVACFALRLRR